MLFYHKSGGGGGFSCVRGSCYYLTKRFNKLQEVYTFYWPIQWYNIYICVQIYKHRVQRNTTIMGVYAKINYNCWMCSDFAWVTEANAQFNINYTTHAFNNNNHNSAQRVNLVSRHTKHQQLQCWREEKKNENERTRTQL